MTQKHLTLADRVADLGRRVLADRRLIAALGSYLILAIVAMAALDGILRGAVLSFLAILAVKTLIHSGQAADD